MLLFLAAQHYAETAVILNVAVYYKHFRWTDAADEFEIWDSSILRRDARLSRW